MDCEHHVHFDVEETASHSNDINIKQRINGSIDIHIGFLQIYHKYNISVNLPSKYIPLISNFVPRIPETPRLFGRIIKITPSNEDGNEGNIVLVFEITPQKEKLHKEKFVIEFDDDKNTMCEIIMHCRVLGKGKGTPMLKNGIKMIEILTDPDESDVNSDWQGF